jgi:hypothetical protein
MLTTWHPLFTKVVNNFADIVRSRTQAMEVTPNVVSPDDWLLVSVRAILGRKPGGNVSLRNGNSVWASCGRWAGILRPVPKGIRHSTVKC